MKNCIEWYIWLFDTRSFCGTKKLPKKMDHAFLRDISNCMEHFDCLSTFFKIESIWNVCFSGGDTIITRKKYAHVSEVSD